MKIIETKKYIYEEGDVCLECKKTLEINKRTMGLCFLCYAKKQNKGFGKGEGLSNKTIEKYLEEAKTGDSQNLIAKRNGKTAFYINKIFRHPEIHKTWLTARYKKQMAELET